MDLEIIKLNEVSQKEERYIPSDITYMWNLKYDTNKPIYETERDSQRKWTIAKRGEGVQERWRERLVLTNVSLYIKSG